MSCTSVGGIDRGVIDPTDIPGPTESLSWMGNDMPGSKQSQSKDGNEAHAEHQMPWFQ